MLAIRLQRKGKKNQPFFKIVVTEKEKSSTRGRFVEEVGFYNPITKEKSLKGERIKYWMSVGAKASDTVHNMLITNSIIEGKKIPKQKKSKKPASSTDGKEEPAVVKPVVEQLIELDETESLGDERPEGSSEPERPVAESPAVETPAENVPANEVEPAKTEEPSLELPKEEPKQDEPTQ